ncbi:hypothetical protein [Terrabacter sp. NPDC080008]|uniref:hypothetical protein n=1 Tax=Terrabacter sp. NPDC080008 TaxID=3155176 RepID=UPI00344E8887
MPVSSLVFVVIVAIWAAYLVQHWARRREDAAATRSMEDFSEAMRVLEKRPALPVADLSTPRPHSYAVKPAVAVRATVDVKRAVPAGAGRRSSPLVARRVNAEVPSAWTAHAGAGPVLHRTDRDIAPDAEVDPMPQTARPTTGPVRSGRPGAAPVVAPVPVSQRRLRALLLLLALLWLPVSIVLTVTGVLMWVSVPFAVLTFVAVVVWLRAEARADRLRTVAGDEGAARRQPGPQARRPAPQRHNRSGRDSRGHEAPERLSVPVLSVEDTQVIRSTVMALQSVTGAAAQPAGDGNMAVRAHEVPRGVFDVQALSTGPVPVPAPAPAAEQAPQGSWSPVPVPPPTYVLKAKAEPRWTDSGIPADVFDTPEFAEEADELDDRALFARRAVSQ